MKEIKIAVCLYGQPRTALYCSPWIKKSFNFLSERETKIWKKQFSWHPPETVFPQFHVDYFCDFKTVSTAGNYPGKWEIPELHHDDQFFTLLKNEYNPKKYCYTNKNDDFIDGNYPFFAPMISSIIKTISLKKQAELQGNYFYDWVFISRYDLLTGPSVNTLGEIVQVNGIEPMNLYIISDEISITPDDCFRIGLNDTFIFGDSLTCDLLAAKCTQVLMKNINNYLHLQNLGPNSFLANCAFDAGLIAKKLPINYAIVRPIANLQNSVFDSWFYHRDFWVTALNNNAIL